MVRVCVVGYGFSGRSFHSYLVGLEPGLVLDSIVTPVPSERERAALDRGVPVFASVEEMLAKRKADLAVLATPHNTHARLAVQLMEAGLNVVTDKAMCITTAEADEMIAVSRSTGKMLSVFHNRRWDWAFNTLRRAVTDGTIGALLCADLTVTHGAPGGWRSDPAVSGGFFYDWGSHRVDQALQLAGAEPTDVWAHIRTREGVSEHGRLRIRFDNGFEAWVEIGGGPGATIPKPHWLVVGTEGTYITWGVDPQERAMIAGDILSATEDPDGRARVVSHAGGHTTDVTLESVRTSWTSFYRNISDVLNGTGAELAVTPESARKVIAVAEAAEVSSRSGATIPLARS